MRDPDYVNRAKLNPARTFKSPMDVVETNDIEPAEKLAILNAWESDERALLRSCPSLDIGSVVHDPSTISHSRRTAGR
jgi:hypothetical protein